MPRLEGKVALITGAGTGIGRATALLFARQGARVVVAETDSEAADRTANDIVCSGGNGIAVKTDVTEPEDIAAMALFLTPEDALKITGQVYPVASGVTIS